MLLRILFFLCSTHLCAHDFAIPRKGKALPVGSVMTGKQFLKYFEGHVFYKILNEKEVHHGFSYSQNWESLKDGRGYLVTDTKELQLKGKEAAGLYFTDALRIKNFLEWGNHARTVTLLDDDLVYIDKGKFRVHRFILSLSKVYRDDIKKSVQRILVGLDLSERDLRWANLTKVNLAKANLRKANLRKANLSEANLYKANLYKANLGLADLRSADLRSADLRWANLNWVNLNWAKLYKADLGRADLRWADPLDHLGIDLSKTRR